MFVRFFIYRVLFIYTECLRKESLRIRRIRSLLSYIDIRSSLIHGTCRSVTLGGEESCTTKPKPEVQKAKGKLKMIKAKHSHKVLYTFRLCFSENSIII